MSNSSRKKILNRKKQRKISARQKYLSQDIIPDTEEIPGSEESSAAEEHIDMEESSAEEDVAADDVTSDDVTADGEHPVTEEQPEAKDISAMIQQAVINDEAEPLLKKIKMEITFSDESTINKEIIISGKEPEMKKAVAETKMPWVAVAILSFIVCASLVTGVYHWYTTYYRQPGETAEPGLVIGGERNPDNNDVNEQGREDEVKNPEQEDADQTGQTGQQEGPRYGIEPLPEFVALWEEYGNEDIVAILTMGETEMLVVQSNDNAFYITHDIHRNSSPQGWVFLDHQVDIFTGLEHNMVIYDPVGEFLRQIIQEYADYDFFLRNPVITLSTLFGEIEWEVFSYYVAPSDFPFAIVDHPDDDVWGDIIEQFTLASLYNTRLDVNLYDQVLTIVVPTTVNPELFYILQARMLREVTS